MYEKVISVCRLFPSNENSSYYENNPQYSCIFQKCFKFTYRSYLNMWMLFYFMHIYSLFGHWYCVYEVGVQKVCLLKIRNCPTHLLLPHIKTTPWMPLTSGSKSHSHSVAFFLKAKLLTKAIAGKSTSRSQNNIKKFKIPKNKPEKPELSNPSTTATYTIAISNIHSNSFTQSKFFICLSIK